LVIGLVVALALVQGTAGQQLILKPQPPERTAASLWYRGMPVGTPRQVDLDAIRAAGFTAVTWPLEHVTFAAELRRMADSAGLKVVIRTLPEPLTLSAALKADTHVDIDVARTPMAMLPALVWRAVAHGARVISFDAGVAEGSGLPIRSGPTPPWLATTASIARQIAVNRTLLDVLSSGPAVRLETPVAGLDVALLQSPRAWVLIATNTAVAGTPPADTYAIMPPGVPPALWLNMFDGSTIGMTSRSTGARWHVILGPGDARVYVIDKVQK
jgi:hypothetical protein